MSHLLFLSDETGSNCDFDEENTRGSATSSLFGLFVQRRQTVRGGKAGWPQDGQSDPVNR